MLHVQFVTVTFLIITVTVCITDSNAQGTAFSVVPQSTTASIETDVTFKCRHPRADTIRWRVNDELISSSNPPPNVTPSTTRDDNNNLVSTLTIAARLEYNQTMVVCVARFDDGSPEQTTEAALLTVVDGAIIYYYTEPPTLPCSFRVAPSEQIVPVMTQATFKCQSACSDGIINWNVNGTLLSTRHPPNITTQSKSDPNGRMHTLTIAAFHYYNATTVECVILYFDDRTFQSSPSANLWIQGKLSAVSNLRRNPSNSILTWTPPFSLNLTNVETDIAYCVNIYNITCGKEDLLIHDCNITAPKYSSDLILQRPDLFQICVVPRSNIQGSVAGVKHVIREKYIHVTGSAISAAVRLAANSSLVDAQILLDLTLLGTNIAPDTFIISLESINQNGLSGNYSARTIKLTPEVAILNVSGLPYGNRWYCTIYADRCGGMSISDTTALSTYDVMNASVSSNTTDGKVKVSCGFIEGSEAAGVLIIAYSTSDPTDIHYHVIPRNGQQSVAETVLSCLPGETYNVLLFVISKNGLPLNFPATQQFPTSVNHGTESNSDKKQCTENEAMISTVYQQGENVCVECYFTSSNDSCVVIVHQNISQFNSTGDRELLTLNITQIKREDSGKTGRTCIPGINLYEYQVGVIPLILYHKPGSVSTKDSESNTLYYIIAGSAITVVVIALVLCIIGWCNRKRCMRSKSLPDPVQPPPVHQLQSVSSSEADETPTSTESPNLNFDQVAQLQNPDNGVPIIITNDGDGDHKRESNVEGTTQVLGVPKNRISNHDSGISTPMEGTTNNVTPILSQRGSNLNIITSRVTGPALDKKTLGEKLRDLDPNDPQAENRESCKNEKDADFSNSDSESDHEED